MAALRAAVRLVRGRLARLTLVHVIEDVSGRMVFSGGEAAQVLRDYEARVASEKHRRLLRLEPLRALDPRQVKLVVASGPPSRVVLSLAADVKADLIAMGTAGLGALGATGAEAFRRVDHGRQGGKARKRKGVSRW
jgi:nucleotide-binding universal stress UspA family protein